MDQSVCKLTLVCPSDAADSLTGLMLGMQPPIAGFTTFQAQGHGFGFATATVSERVRGRVERSVIVAVMPKAEAYALLETIRAKLPIAHMAYWLEPVIDCGRLVKSAPVAIASAPSRPGEASP